MVGFVGIIVSIITLSVGMGVRQFPALSHIRIERLFCHSRRGLMDVQEYAPLLFEILEQRVAPTRVVTDTVIPDSVSPENTGFCTFDQSVGVTTSPIYSTLSRANAHGVTVSTVILRKSESGVTYPPRSV